MNAGSVCRNFFIETFIVQRESSDSLGVPLYKITVALLQWRFPWG